MEVQEALKNLPIENVAIKARCHQCNGTGKLRGFGQDTQECWHCEGVGLHETTLVDAIERIARQVVTDVLTKGMRD